MICHEHVQSRILSLKLSQETVRGQFILSLALKVYWTESKVCVRAENLEGLCYVMAKCKIVEKEPFLWSQKGLFKFYYDELFNVESKLVEALNEEALNSEPPPNTVPDLPLLDKPLNMLDVFAGIIFQSQ